MNRQEYRKLIKELGETLKTHPHFIIVASNGEEAKTLFNGDNHKIAAAVTSSVIHNKRSNEIFNTVKILLENNQAYIDLIGNKKLKVNK